MWTVLPIPITLWWTGSRTLTLRWIGMQAVLVALGERIFHTAVPAMFLYPP